MKDKADCFDEMIEHEAKIRLHEAGWKDRYYEVRVVTDGWRALWWRQGGRVWGAHWGRGGVG